MATIAVIGTLDSKGEEHAFVAELIRARGHDTLLIDVGSGDPPTIVPDIRREEVAAAAGLDLTALLARHDRGECVVAMSGAAPVLLARLAAEGEIQGVISLGGGGGTAISTAAMRALPLGFPKLMVSTLAAGNVAPYLGTKDIVMMPSIADVARPWRLEALDSPRRTSKDKPLKCLLDARKEHRAYVGHALMSAYVAAIVSRQLL